MNKYRSRKTVVNGIKFASKLEADRYMQLRMMMATEPPLICDLVLQPEFQIFHGYVDPDTGEKVRSKYYVADFQYTDVIEHKVIVEDTKGVETDVFRLKWDVVKKKYPEFEFRKLTKKECNAWIPQ